ncbi:MAG: CHAD domain-containing protein [Methyloprofundus sp.]|nr:CHAD domain-containing protein [Methyloprofundus sp.]
MTENTNYFEIPANLTIKKFISKLSKQVDLQIISQQYTIKTFYDSFDWRLYSANMLCEHKHSQKNSELRLVNNKTGQLLSSMETEQVPDFSQLFTDESFRQLLSPELQMRALLPLCHLSYEAYLINILNKDQKTILRLQVDEYELLNNRLQLLPLKGYEKAHQKIAQLLQDKFNLLPSASCTVLNEALKHQGRKPQDYSSKLSIKLKPEMRADKASQLIYKHLLHAIHINEAGTIDDTDSEFLHDFRVAVRRTRAGLSQIKNTLPAEIVAKYASFFAWLGQITGPTRDLDVYLLSYPNYKEVLPESLQDDIAPLYDFLMQKQQQAHNELAEKLKSPEYTKQLLEWETYLKQSLPKKGSTTEANQTIQELADLRIWKVYQRVLKEGGAIEAGSPPEALHDLRKTCKKLRYLMEFFQDLYPAQDIKRAIKSLKGFQAILGDFQDYEIQELSIKQFSEEMMANLVASNTLLAMGVLVQYLDVMKCKARNHFSEQFTLFVEAENKAMFTQLFKHKA